MALGPEGVVVGAEQGQVFQVGLPALAPGNAVVALAVVRLPVAAWPAAATVAVHQGQELLVGARAAPPAQPEGVALLVDQHRDQLGVRGDPAHHLPADRGLPVEQRHPRPRVSPQGLQGGRDQQVRLLARPGRQLPRVQRPAGQLVQPVHAALPGAPPILLGLAPQHSLDGRAQPGPLLDPGVPAELEGAVPALTDVEEAELVGRVLLGRHLPGVEPVPQVLREVVQLVRVALAGPLHQQGLCQVDDLGLQAPALQPVQGAGDRDRVRKADRTSVEGDSRLRPRGQRPGQPDPPVGRPLRKVQLLVQPGLTHPLAVQPLLLRTVERAHQRGGGRLQPVALPEDAPQQLGQLLAGQAQPRALGHSVDRRSQGSQPVGNLRTHVSILPQAPHRNIR